MDPIGRVAPEALAAAPADNGPVRRTAAPAISVIIPVYNGAPQLARCLEAMRQSQGIAWECIVVDDGSTDDTLAVAQLHGARVARTGQSQCGPGRARNLGAQLATAPLLCFVDADVLVRPDTLVSFVDLFAADASLDAAFGSYDIHPEAPGLLSQYRNLLHHFVHQTGREAASSFWAGCGAMRRDAFLALGGFDPGYTRPSIEDIDLGYRLHARGGRIRLAKQIQVTHLKRWTFWGMLRTDVWDRALPWTALILRTRHLPNDLNLQTAHRVSALSVIFLAVILAVGLWQPHAWLGALLVLAILLICNRTLYAFFLAHRGAWFLVRAVPLHLLYYAYSSLAFAYGVAYVTVHRRGSGGVQTSVGWQPEGTQSE